MTRQIIARPDHVPATLPEWSVSPEGLTRTFTFPGFPEAVAFVQRLVAPAEAAGHHPDIDIRYNKVKIALTTHDAGGITAADGKMAAQIDQLTA